jgi:hypothetical protein
MPSTSWFGSGISYQLESKPVRELYGKATSDDFDSYRKLSDGIHERLKSFTCPNCGCHTVSGSGLIVEYGKVHLLETVTVKGWFGRTKQKDRRAHTVWRIHDYRLFRAPGRHIFNFFALLDPGPGELKCYAAGCNWSINGGRHGTQTLGQVLQRLSVLI